MPIPVCIASCSSGSWLLWLAQQHVAVIDDGADYEPEGAQLRSHLVDEEPLFRARALPVQLVRHWSMTRNLCTEKAAQVSAG
jgi:hypothetical protein